MIAALPLILMAQAEATCAATPGLAGGATIVRPVGTSEPPPFEWLGPTEKLGSDVIRQVNAADQPEEKPQPDQSSNQCKGGPIIIV